MAGQRVQIIARVSPDVHDAIKNRAKGEGRSIGEMIGIVQKERDLMALTLQLLSQALQAERQEA